MKESSSWSTSLPPSGVVNGLDFGRSNVCVVVANYSLNLQFSDDI